MDKGLIYKMKDVFRLQSWYTTDYFKLVKEHHDQEMIPFGHNCIWLNLNTGEKIARWNMEFEPISKEESREYKLNKILK